MLRASLVASAIALVLSGPAAAVDPPPTVSLPLPQRIAQHLTEAAAHRQALERAREVGAVSGESWAPILPPSAVDVLHYELDLSLDLQRRVIGGTVRVELAAVEDNLATVELDANQGLRVLSVTLVHDAIYPHDAPRVLSFEHQNDRLAVALPRSLAAGEQIALLIAYGGHGSSYGLLGLDGVGWDYHASGQAVVSTFAEPFGARAWWPCNDRPDDKATVDVTVTAPSGLTIASNGLMEQRVENADGTATTRWSSRYPVSTYLVVMNASNYDLSQRDYTALDGSTMPVVLYSYPEHATQAQSDFANTSDMITLLAQRFGEYPFVEEKYGNCISPFGGAMEHQTLTTMTEWAVGSDYAEWYNVHELGHQWWGDWVTTRDWQNLWLNEGFATYVEFLWAERLGPEALAAYAEEADWMGYFTGALYDNPEPFGATVYQKGGLVLHMLRHVVGDDAFFAGLASYRAAFGGSTATSEGLREHMEAASGTDLAWFFDEWVYGDGRPRYQYSWSEVPGPAVRLTVKQVQTNSPLYRMPMDVRVTTTAGREETVVWLEPLAEQSFDLPLAAAPTAVVLDPDHQVLCELGPASDPDLDLGPDYPGPYDFGILAWGSTATRTVPLTNLGGSNLVVSAIYPWLTNTFTLESPTSLPLTLAPGETEDLVIRANGQGVGNEAEIFVIESNDPSHGGRAFLELSVVTAMSAEPRVYVPASAPFSRTPVGGSKETMVEVANVGAAPATLGATVVGDMFSLASTVPAEIGPGQTVRIGLRFTPTAVGMVTGSLVLATNDPTNPEAVVALSGEGTAAPRIQVEPPALTFGLVTGAADATIDITNGGQTALVVSALTVAAPFSLPEPWTLPATLEPGENRQLAVGFRGNPDGTSTGTLQVLSNDPGLPLAEIPLLVTKVSGPTVSTYVAAAARQEGVGGAFWVTDLALVNPTSSDIDLDLSLMPSDVRAAGAPDLTLSVPAGRMRVVDDLLGQMGLDGVGGVRIDATAAGLHTISRTYSDEAQGTYGQLIPAVAAEDALRGGRLYLIPGLAEGNGFHTNFGILDLGEEAIEVSFALYDGAGRSVGTAGLTAIGGTFAQSVRAYAIFTSAEIRGGYAIVSCSDPSAQFLAYASLVDDGSHDPTYLSPVDVTQPQPLDDVIPAVASTVGLGGSVWRSQLDLVNATAVPATVTLELHPRDAGATASAQVEVEGGRSLQLDDVVGQTLGTSGSGWLRVTSDEVGVVASSRTFNDAATGTFGQDVPAVPVTAAVAGGVTALLPGLSGADGFRTNVGIASLGTEDATCELRAFGEDGAPAGELTVVVPASRLVQLDRLLPDMLAFDGHAFATVTCSGAGGFVPYASVIDGATGDPVLILAEPLDGE